jgi:hypothetical protein
MCVIKLLLIGSGVVCGMNHITDRASEGCLADWRRGVCHETCPGLTHSGIFIQIQCTSTISQMSRGYITAAIRCERRAGMEEMQV